MKRKTKQISILMTSVIIFALALVISLEKNANSEWIIAIREASAQSEGGESERTEKTYRYALINPSQSSINMNFPGGQNVSGTATNHNVLGVSLNWVNNFMNSSSIYSGTLWPSESVSMTDGIFGYEPLSYKYTGSTGSSVAHISFVYKTTF